jgi:hypothetical protein
MEKIVVIGSVQSMCELRRNLISSGDLRNLQSPLEAPKIFLGISPKHCQSDLVGHPLSFTPTSKTPHARSMSARVA